MEISGDWPISPQHKTELSLRQLSPTSTLTQTMPTKNRSLRLLHHQQLIPDSQTHVRQSTSDPSLLDVRTTLTGEAASLAFSHCSPKIPINNFPRVALITDSRAAAKPPHCHTATGAGSPRHRTRREPHVSYPVCISVSIFHQHGQSSRQRGASTIRRSDIKTGRIQRSDTSLQEKRRRKELRRRATSSGRAPI